MPSEPRRSLSTDANLARVVAMRGARGFVDGLASVILATHLTDLGLSTTRIGLVVTAMMIGSAGLTLLVGWSGAAHQRRSVLLAASVLMITTGAGFAVLSSFGLLMVLAFVGTLNPSSGDVSVFLPTEQALIPQLASRVSRTRTFARYALAGSVGGTLGALAAGVPSRLGDALGMAATDANRLAFVAYGLVGVLGVVLYRGLSVDIEQVASERVRLGEARPAVLRLAALFSLDSFASGFAVQSMLALWLFLRFDFSTTTLGFVFFWTGLMASASLPLAARLSDRFGMINTMVFTHIPANCLLIGAAFAPNATVAVGLLVARGLFAAMDVPARTSFVMSVVSAEQRAAAAAFTNVPRSLAAAVGPTFAGAMLSRSTFGWPLVVAGTLKIAYDLTLWRQFGATEASLS